MNTETDALLAELLARVTLMAQEETPNGVRSFLQADVLALARELDAQQQLEAIARERMVAAEAELETVKGENAQLTRNLLTVQNAAKNLHLAQGTELEHYRQNRTYDHKLRSEHESLLERDAQMTAAVEQAEARADRSEALIRELVEALEPFTAAEPYLCEDGTGAALIVRPRDIDTANEALTRARTLVEKQP